MQGNHIDDFISDYKGSNLSLNNSESAMIKSASFTVEKLKPAGHGMCLTTSDHDRLRIFIHEFAVRALIPWAERQMKLLSDVVGVLTLRPMDPDQTAPLGPLDLWTQIRLLLWDILAV